VEEEEVRSSRAACSHPLMVSWYATLIPFLSFHHRDETAKDTIEAEDCESLRRIMSELMDTVTGGEPQRLSR